jgi:hypothetical protein
MAKQSPDQDFLGLSLSPENKADIELAKIRLKEGTFFEAYLIKIGYTQLEHKRLFYKTTPKELIELLPRGTGYTYINHVNNLDQGTFLNFIQNRLSSNRRVVVTDDQLSVMTALLVGLFYEKKLSHKRGSKKQSSRKQTPKKRERTTGGLRKPEKKSKGPPSH